MILEIEIESPDTVKNEADEKNDVSLVYKSQFWAAPIRADRIEAFLRIRFRIGSNRIDSISPGPELGSRHLWGNISKISGPFSEI